MKYELYKEVVLLTDIPEKKLKKGDVATVVDHHPSKHSEDGYTLEIFNVLGDSIAVITVSETNIAPLKRTEVFNVRSTEVPTSQQPTSDH